jgi:hypothetical protein
VYKNGKTTLQEGILEKGVGNNTYKSSGLTGARN